MTIPNLLSWCQDGVIVLTSQNIDPITKKIARRLQHKGVAIEYTRDCVIDVDTFDDGELKTTIRPNVRDKGVFLVWAFTPENFVSDINIQIDKLKRALGALKASGVARVILVLPYLPYSTQDRPLYRQPMSVKDLLLEIESYGIVKQLITFDLHVPHIAGYANTMEIINVPAHVIFAPFFREYFAEDIATGRLRVLATDVGGSKRAQGCAEHISPGLDIAIIDKRRDRPGESRAVKLIGETSPVMIGYDDIGRSITSLLNAGSMASQHGAERFFGAITHNVLCPKDGTTAEEKIEAAGITVFTLDTLPRGKAYYKKHPFIKRVPYHNFMADLMLEIMSRDGSIGKLMEHWERG